MSETLQTVVPSQRLRSPERLHEKGRWQADRGKKIATLVVLALAAVFVVLPLYVVLTNAFKTTEDAQLSQMWLLPPEFSLSGMSQAWTQLRGSLGNSIILVIPATLISWASGQSTGMFWPSSRRSTRTAR